jgi:hypothetical protein
MEWWRIAIYVSVGWLLALFVVSSGIELAILSRATAIRVDQEALDRITMVSGLLITAGTVLIWMVSYGLRDGISALAESKGGSGQARRLSDGSRPGPRKRKRKAGRRSWWLIATTASIAWTAVAFGFPIGVMFVYDSAHPMGPVVSEARGYVTGHAAGMLALSGVFLLWISLYFWSRESPRP